MKFKKIDLQKLCTSLKCEKCNENIKVKNDKVRLKTKNSNKNKHSNLYE